MFLTAQNPQAAKRAGQVIERHFALLEKSPEAGRPFPDFAELRELVIDFGNTGYVAMYRFEPADDAVYVLAFRHQKEVGY
jgi:plasmid stabilization system protein ParE